MEHVQACMHVLTTAPAPHKFGHQVLCSDYTTNVPVFSNFGLSPQELLPHRPSRRPPSRLTSRLSHITPPTTAPVNGSAASPAIGHGTTPKTAPALAAPKCTAAAGDTRHTATFMFTDGDSLTWDLGNFASSASDWWGSKWRGTVPIAWTFQPVLQELHPYFLRWVHLNATTNDTLLVGPSGAGYTYLDRYPDGLGLTLTTTPSLPTGTRTLTVTRMAPHVPGSARGRATTSNAPAC